MSNKFYPMYTAGRLDPQSETVLEQIEKAKGKPLTEQTIEEARAGFLVKGWLGGIAGNVSMREIEIEGKGGKIPCHVHTPKGSGPFPVLLFFHGGGFVVGALDEFDPLCSQLSAGAECVVVSVGYRLAPEHKHPAQVEDAESALDWIVNNAAEINSDSSRIAVAGDSAGGNLSAVISIVAKEKGIKLVHQILICPWLNLNSFDNASYKNFGNGLWLSTESIHWYINHYLKEKSQSGSNRVSPGLLLDVTGMPPALLITAEFDVLCSEGEEYSRKLINAGVPVKYSMYKGMLHDFVILPGLFDKSVEAVKEICETLKEAFK